MADRLFKLRHCQNIEGVTRQLALFDAPIDPGLLVRAQAAGVDIGSVLSDTQAPLPSYRFAPLYAQAQEFCSAVRDYGSKVLAALERRDAEELATLLATQQQQLLADADQIYDAKVDEAQRQIDSLDQSLALAQASTRTRLAPVHEHGGSGRRGDEIRTARTQDGSGARVPGRGRPARDPELRRSGSRIRRLARGRRTRRRRERRQRGQERRRAAKCSET